MERRLPPGSTTSSLALIRAELRLPEPTPCCSWPLQARAGHGFRAAVTELASRVGLADAPTKRAAMHRLLLANTRCYPSARSRPALHRTRCLRYVVTSCSGAPGEGGKALSGAVTAAA